MTDPFAPIRRNILLYFGAAGAAWLEHLPDTLAWCSQQWQLEIGQPFADLSINYVTSATMADGTRAVLKLGPPNPELSAEIAALELYAGRGIAALLAGDADHGALLLEQLEPGTPLMAEPDDELATTIAADVMRALWRPLPPTHHFINVAAWAQNLDDVRPFFGGTPGPFGMWLDRAQGLFAELLSSQGPPVLLHGDLHHRNILRAEREPWLAIDPKGVVGEAEYDVGALIRNPMPHFLEVPDPARMLARRLDLLAERLGFDRERMRLWSIAQTVLGAWWGYDEHHTDWRTWLRCAELLDGLGR